MTRVPMGTPNVLPAKAGLGTYKSPRMEERYPNIQFSQFTGAERIAAKYGHSKEQLDRYALESHRRAIAATQAGRFQAEILPLAVRRADGGVDTELHSVDEGIRFDASMGLPVSFRPWNNQMRTPILLSTADSVLEIAPIEGFLHKSNQLDTLGEDQPDTTCKFQ